MERGIRRAGLVSRLQACDGAQATYQVSVGAAQPYHAFLTDLATAGSTADLSGSGPAAYKVTRSRLNLVLAPQTHRFRGGRGGEWRDVHARNRAGRNRVDFRHRDWRDRDRRLLSISTVSLRRCCSASPFQVNAVVPASLAPGAALGAGAVAFRNCATDGD